MCEVEWLIKLETLSKANLTLDLSGFFSVESVNIYKNHSLFFYSILLTNKWAILFLIINVRLVSDVGYNKE